MEGGRRQAGGDLVSVVVSNINNTCDGLHRIGANDEIDWLTASQ